MLNVISNVLRSSILQDLPATLITDEIDEKRPINYWKTVWISDVHLGSFQCDAEALLDFIKYNRTEKLYLVGDILDLWAMKAKIYWPTSHNTVVQKILKMARKGTEVIYIPGNHDEFIRNHFVGIQLGDQGKDITVKDRDVHVALDGRKYLVVHGDEYDTIAKYAVWIAKLGSWAYDFLLDMNRFYRFVRKIFGMSKTDFSLSAFIKYKVKNAVQFISDYETSIVASLKDAEVNGVICGHIHHAELKEMSGFTYANDGDWVESCTALVEDFQGKLRLLRWKDEMKKVIS
jgi:UDP-2,3-diacylglucosamine pyrophosphatase LpxH